jgi:thiosulfate sulfurtransferase
MTTQKSDFPPRRTAEISDNPAQVPGATRVSGARGLSADALGTLILSGTRVQVLDVRRAPAFVVSGFTISGATRIDPEDLPDTLDKVDRHCLVVAVCVHGHEVSQGVAAQLRSEGFDACFLEGGMEIVQRTNLLPLAPIEDAEGRGHE